MQEQNNAKEAAVVKIKPEEDNKDNEEVYVVNQGNNKVVTIGHTCVKGTRKRKEAI
jgi:hypothetical protein